MNGIRKIEGLKELDRALGDLPKATQKRVLRKVGKESLQPMADDMKTRAPRRFGDLVEGVGVSEKLVRSQTKSFNGGPIDRHMIVIHAGPGGHPQAVIQEIGSFKEAAQPYVTPSWEAGKDRLLRDVASGLERRITDSAKRAARKAARAKRG